MRPTPRPSAERRAALAEFSTAEIMRHLAERGAAPPSFGFVADLAGQARRFSLAAPEGSELRRKHAQVFHSLNARLREWAAGKASR